MPSQAAEFSFISGYHYHATDFLQFSSLTSSSFPSHEPLMIFSYGHIFSPYGRCHCRRRLYTFTPLAIFLRTIFACPCFAAFFDGFPDIFFRCFRAQYFQIFSLAWFLSLRLKLRFHQVITPSYFSPAFPRYAGVFISSASSSRHAAYFRRQSHCRRRPLNSLSPPDG